MSRILLFPGFFDPFHLGHLSMALKASAEIQADSIDFHVLDIRDCSRRKLLLEDGISGLKGKTKKLSLKVTRSLITSSDYEELLTGFVLKMSYCHPKDTLYLLLGANDYLTFLSFQQKEKISKRVHILVYPREGYDVSENFLEQGKATLLNEDKIPYDAAKIRKGSILPLGYKEMCRIADNKLYFMNEVKSHMKDSRYKHSVSVAKTAYKIALTNGLDPQKAFLAGLLHDCAKDYPLDQQKKIVAEYFREYMPVEDFALHQFAGRYLAETQYGVEDENILTAIEFHCTGRSDMSLYEKLLYAADKVEPKRNYETKKSRAACLDDLEEGFLVTLKEQQKYFVSNNIPYAEEKLSQEMYNQYLGEENA